MTYLVEFQESGDVRRVAFNERTDAILYAISRWKREIPAVVYSVYKRRLIDRSYAEQILKLGGNSQWENSLNSQG